MQGVFGRAFEPVPVLVEKGAKEAERRDFLERVDECRGYPRQHIQVAVASLDETEKARTVHPLSAGQDCQEIILVSDGKCECLQLPVSCRVHEIDHSDAVPVDECNDILQGEFFR